MGHPGLCRAVLWSGRRRLHHGRCRAPRVRGQGREVPQTPHHPLQVLHGRRPRGQGLPLPHRADGRDRGRPHAERPGRDPGRRRPDPGPRPPPAHGRLRHHRHGEVQLHEDLLRLLHEGAEVRPADCRPARRVRQRRQVLDRRVCERPRPLHEREGRPLHLHHPQRGRPEEVRHEPAQPRVRRLPDQRPLHPL